MRPQNNLFTSSSKFCQFEQSSTLGVYAYALDMSGGGQSRVLSADTGGICFGYCLIWLEEIRKNKSYLLKGFSAKVSGASDQQEDMKSRFNASGYSNALVLAGWTPSGKTDLNANIDQTQLAGHLTTLASAGCYFVMFIISGTDHTGKAWAHAIAAKLNRSSTGGYLNWSYPCALFDPNYGQGMYNSHDYLARDIVALFARYNITGVYSYGLGTSRTVN